MPSVTDLSAATIESWTTRLTEEARDLDLTDARVVATRALADAWIERSNVRDWRHTFDARLLLDTAGIGKRSE